jgi:hypothetical protein
MGNSAPSVETGTWRATISCEDIGEDIEAYIAGEDIGEDIE